MWGWERAAEGHARHFAVHWCGDPLKCQPNREAAGCLAAYFGLGRRHQGIGKIEQWECRLAIKQQFFCSVFNFSPLASHLIFLEKWLTCSEIFLINVPHTTSLDVSGIKFFLDVLIKAVPHMNELGRGEISTVR